VTVRQARNMPMPSGERSVTVLRHGTLLVKFYQPQHVDEQTPHTRDEVYVVTSGQGWFVNGKGRHRFETGDVLFVAAGTVHRFEDFSDDFSTWVLFYGPEGGEPAGADHSEL